VIYLFPERSVSKVGGANAATIPRDQEQDVEERIQQKVKRKASFMEDILIVVLHSTVSIDGWGDVP
jgi:hypothetical protein